GHFQPHPVCIRYKRETRGRRAGPLEIAGPIPAALLGRAMGDPVRRVHKARLESPLSRRLFVRPSSAGGAVPVLFTQSRRGVLRVEQGADVYTLSAAGKPAFRDCHCFGRTSDHWQASIITGPTALIP